VKGSLSRNSSIIHSDDKQFELIHRELPLPDTLEDEIKEGFFEFKKKFSSLEPSSFFVSHVLLH
jgi:hypothetical protein